MGSSREEADDKLAHQFVQTGAGAEWLQEIWAEDVGGERQE